MRSDEGARGAEIEGIRGLAGPVRAFVALPCPPLLRAAIAPGLKEWRELDAPVAWVDPASAHLTLRFLGTADPVRLGRLHEGLGPIAGAAEPVRARAGRTGAFPGWSRPRVFWLAIESDGAIERLAASIEKLARQSGFDPEERGFTPHLTLGRARGRGGLRNAADAVRAWSPSAPPEAIPELGLFRSELRPSGARHIALARYRIGGTGS